MATVPIAQPQIRQQPVGTPYQSASAPAGAFGAGIGQAVQQLGQSTQQVANQMADRAIQMQIEDNERTVKDMDVALAQSIREITYGTDEDEGYYARRGEVAISEYKSTQDRIREARRLVGERAQGNESVMRMYGDIADRREQRELDTMSRHVASERRAAHDATSEARLGEALDDAGANWNNQTVIRQSLGVVRSEVRDMAERNGWSVEVAASKMEEAESALHRSVIDAAVERNPGFAAAYFRDNKENIDGRLHASIEKVLEVSTVRASSQASADAIMALNLPEADALARAREIKDAKLRDETVSRVTQRYGENERIRQRQERDTKDEAWSTIVNGGSVDDLPAQTLAGLDGPTLNSMLSFENNRAKDGRGFASSTDPAAYNELHTLYMDDKRAFTEFDLNSMIGALDEQDYQYWAAQQRSVDKAAAKEASYALADRMAREYMNAAGIDYGASAGKRDAGRAQKVLTLIRTMVDEAHEAGKPATRDDIDRGLKELFLTGEVDGSGLIYDTNQAFLNVAGTPEAENFVLVDYEGQKQAISEVTGVPVAHVSDVIKALEDRDIPVTPAAIQQLYEDATSGR